MMQTSSTLVEANGERAMQAPTEHDEKKCETELHHIFQTARVSMEEEANRAISIYLDSIKKCSTVYEICSCNVLKVWVGSMEEVLFKMVNKLQLFLITWDEEKLIGNFKTEEEALVTRGVLYHCSTAFVKKMCKAHVTAVVGNSGVPSIEVAHLPPNNSVVPPAIAVPKPGEFYQCCPLVKRCEKDLESFVAVECENCNEVKHTRCALVSNHLCLKKHLEIGEITCYNCGCGYKNWKIIGDIFYRVKALIEDIGKVKIPQRGKRKRIDAQNARDEVVRKLKKVLNNLFKIVGTTKPRGFISVVGKNPNMNIIFINVLKMVDDLEKDEDQVEFESWLTMIDDVVRFFDTIEMEM